MRKADENEEAWNFDRREALGQWAQEGVELGPCERSNGKRHGVSHSDLAGRAHAGVPGDPRRSVNPKRGCYRRLGGGGCPI